MKWAVSRGGDYLNLRFTGANGDLEPGRCRRTDGKKWRCSRDVAPGQKYCERHVHRARPRSRKPVELDGRADPAAAANTAETVSTTSGAIKHGAPSTTAKPAAARPSAQSSPGLPASGADLKFPFQFMVPEDKKLKDTPRRFIDAWSRSENPFNGVTIGDGYKTNSGDGSCCIRSLGNLSPSNLTLSMPGTGVGGGEHHDHFQMGIRATDSGKMLAPSWMSTVSPIGGPLAEVLQTSSTVSFRNERAGHENDAAPRGSGGLIDLMCKTSCDSEGTSPRRGFSSPTRVLQKALVSLSDSSSNSSPTFGLGRRPELGLQWSSPSN
ncbi:hypothetical protein Taro_034681 [Colocasia esculenta]|uniref:Growth-regulating factor n=1 Tax=Colocasia esculenta TaxID=4460 RepID=A0A843VX15_COLES|nr:hypothetical protein [Colocasia esculenta]